MTSTTTSRAETHASPIEPTRRISSLDAVRGIAVLGIVTMNVVNFALSDASYFNISASSPQSPLDWFVGGFGEVFFDQKFMALFSMLFGAGVVLFAERVAARGGRPVALTLWRNFLLLLIGLVHMMVWDGDVLVIYALCAPLVLTVRRASPKVLFAVGGLVMITPSILAAFTQASIPPSGAGLGSYWGVPGAVSDSVIVWEIFDGWFRAFGAMLIGVALYRIGFLTGARSTSMYRDAAKWGLGIGVPMSAMGLAFIAASSFAPSTALIGSIPNSIATIPIAVAYAALILMWHRANVDRPFDIRIRDVGRMALTNYLTQTALAVIFLQGILSDVSFTRTALVGCVVFVWVLQLGWSKAWLSRFRFGPVEWLWRLGTYGRIP